MKDLVLYPEASIPAVMSDEKGPEEFNKVS